MIQKSSKLADELTLVDPPETMANMFSTFWGLQNVLYEKLVDTFKFHGLKWQSKSLFVSGMLVE